MTLRPHMRGQKEKMLAGELYRADDPELLEDSRRASELLERYNATSIRAQAERQALMAELFAKVGKGCTVKPQFCCVYGYNIEFGDDVFLNFNCVLLDVAKITIGSKTQIGPGVQILTADHPRKADLRAQMLESGRPVTIGANVWIGAGALILPGVMIGDDAIIGAGSVVTRPVPAGMTAVGSPARPKL